MIESVANLAGDLNRAFLETAVMMAISAVLAAVGGIPLGVLLYAAGSDLLGPSPWLHRASGLLVNVIRSMPFVILLTALIPLTAFITGSIMGPVAASVPLTVAAIPFYGRLVEGALKEIPRGIIEAALSMGASTAQIVGRVLLREAAPSMILAFTVTLISLLGYSAMAGIVGGGGIGDLAIRYGYYRFDDRVMYSTVVVLIVIVQLIQGAGDWLARRNDRR